MANSGAMGFKDLTKVVGSMVKATIIGYLLSPRQWFNKTPNHPGEF
jgi:hypothetical protein